MINKLKMKKLFNLGNISEFSFSEMFNNDSGRTSITKFCGFYIIIIGGIAFILGCIDKMFLDKSINILSESIIFTSIGASLLGIKNFAKDKDIQYEAKEINDNKNL